MKHLALMWRIFLIRLLEVGGPSTMRWHFLVVGQIKAHGGRNFAFHLFAFTLAGKLLLILSLVLQSSFFRFPTQIVDHKFSRTPPRLLCLNGTSQLTQSFGTELLPGSCFFFFQCEVSIDRLPRSYHVSHSNKSLS